MKNNVENVIQLFSHSRDEIEIFQEKQVIIMVAVSLPPCVTKILAAMIYNM